MADDIHVSPNGHLLFQGKPYRCALGRGGVRSDKVEGDGATPAGSWRLRNLLYRADRIAKPHSLLAAAPIGSNDGWCDDPGDPAYNQPVILPYAARHERLWRDDGLYDVVAVLGYNDDPPLPGRGSAIFLHVAQPDYRSTEGCVALAMPDLLRVIAQCGPETKLVVSD